MPTQMTRALAGETTEEMRVVAQKENKDPEEIRQGVASGILAIPANTNHKHLSPEGFGKGLRTKVNANIGTSTSYPDISVELEKMDTAVKAGADARTWTGRARFYSPLIRKKQKNIGAAATHPGQRPARCAGTTAR